jgi:predicted RNA binding protein YcfA (HicA-like mRNA interferase family)
MTVRELRKRCSSLGAVLLRHTDGSHEVWRFPSGDNVSIKANKPGDTASPGIMSDVRRALKKSGLSL